MSTQPKTSSVFTPSSSSARAVPSRPPTGNQSRAPATAGDQPRAPATTGSREPPIDPVISNNDIFALFSQVKKQMEEQTRTNINLFREIDELRKGKKPVDDVSPIVPRVLDFDAPTSDAAKHYASSSANPPRSAILQNQGSISAPVSSSTVQPRTTLFQSSSFQNAQESFMNARQGFQMQ